MNIELAIRAMVAEEVAAAEKRILERMKVSADQTLSFAEALEYLNVSEYTLRRWCREKRIPHRTVGSEGSKNPRYLFSSASLDQWKHEEETRNYERKGTQ